MGKVGRRYLGLLGTALAMLMAFTLACGDDKSEPPVPVPSGVQYGGNLRHALNISMESLDPAFDSNAPEIITSYLIYNQLLALDAGLNVIPEVTESWNVSSDGKTITFNIRKGIKFHDGKTLDAESVKWTLDRCLDPVVICTSRGKIEVIDRVTVEDDYTVTVHLTKPWRPIMAALAEIAGFVPSQDAVEKANSYAERTGDFGRDPVGSGAFRFKEWRPDDFIIVEKNDDYWEKGKPFLDEIRLQHVSDAQTQLAMVRTGNTDIISETPADLASLVRGNPDVRVDEYQSGRTYIIRLLSDRPPFDNKALRQAVGFAINRQVLIDVIYGGFGRPAYTMGGVGWAYNPSIRPITYDAQMARQKVAEAGYDGSPINYRCSSATQAVTQCEAIQAMLADVGIKAEINQVVPQDFFTGVREGNYAMSDGFRTPLGDPHLLVSEVYQQGGRGNYTGYANATVDSLLDQAGGIFDTAQAKALYDQVKTIVAEDATTIYKMWSTELAVMSSKVQNFQRTPDLDVRLRELWLSK